MRWREGDARRVYIYIITAIYFIAVFKLGCRDIAVLMDLFGPVVHVYPCMRLEPCLRWGCTG